MYFHYGQITGTHHQAEALNYETFYRDIDVSHDPGTTGYGSKFTSEFFRSGLCHNVPLVDGAGGFLAYRSAGVLPFHQCCCQPT